MLSCGLPSHRLANITRRCSYFAVKQARVLSFSKATERPDISSMIVEQGDQVSNRCKAAVLGALVADAATMGLHWIYDPVKMQNLVAEKGCTERPEFFEPPSCPFYQHAAGDFSPYGVELLAVLEYLAEHSDSNLDGPHFAQFLAQFYKSQTGYLNKSSKSMMAAVLDEGKTWPECGDAKDTQANSFVKVPALVARYAGKPQLAAAVEAAVRAQQNNELSISLGLAAARMLEKVVLGSTVEEAVEAVVAEGGISADTAAVVKTAVARKSDDYTELVQKVFGPSCGNPGALQNAVVAGIQAKGDYVSAVRANLLAGGDNCSRGVLVGALVAAQGGLECLPQDWLARTSRYAHIHSLVDKLMMKRSA